MDNLQPGQMLGPYRLIHQIGQGGMATVYKAYHAAMDRYVAVKVLPRQLADSPEFLGRFQLKKVAKNLPKAVGVGWAIRTKREGKDHRSAK